MKQYPIPQQALARLRAAYQQFEGVAAIIADTLEVPDGPRRVDIEHGVFVIEEEEEQLAPNGKVPEEVSV